MLLLYAHCHKEMVVSAGQIFCNRCHFLFPIASGTSCPFSTESAELFTLPKPDPQPISPLQSSMSTPQHKEQTQAHGQASSCLLDAAQLSLGLKTPIRTQKETYTKHAFIFPCAGMTQGESKGISSTVYA